jgi:hypothetical protein
MSPAAAVTVHTPFISIASSAPTVFGVIRQEDTPVNISARFPQATRLRTFVLVDPTSPDGETSLDALDPTDDHVSLVVLISGRSSSALRQFAEIEGIDPASAASIYLDQVAERIAGDDRVVECIVATGPDPALEIADLVALNDTRRVILPSSLQRPESDACRRLIDTVPLVVCGDHAAAVS